MNIFGFIACAIATLVAAPDQRTASTKSPKGAVQVAASGDVESFYGIPIALTVSGLRRLPYRVVRGQEIGEGDLQTYYTITARQGITVRVVFSSIGKLYLAESKSSNAVGPRGIGVGSSLSEVEATWPKGKLLYGSEDGQFVTFDTGTNLLYVFDPRDMPDAAFGHPRIKVTPPNLKVTRVRVFAR